jgi:lipopolysaccharide biosynthesis glycosyltransferase
MKTIHVACCFDDQMAIPASVVAASVAATTRDANVKFHMVHPAPLSVSIAALKHRLERRGFEVIDTPIQQTAPKLAGLRVAEMPTYYRLLLPDIINADRVIYLDCDTMARRSLTPLYEMDLHGHALAAAQDYALTYHMRDHAMPLAHNGAYMKVEEYCADVLALDLSRQAYFNNGVLVMDLKQWRETNLGQRIFDFRRRQAGLTMADQDAANAVLQGAFAPLDARWNAFSYLHAQYFRPAGEPPAPIFGGFERNLRAPHAEWREILEKWRYDAWIVHFSHMSKPWEFSHCRTNYDGEYWRNALRTPFGPRLRKYFKESRRQHQRAAAEAKKHQALQRPGTTLRLARAAARRSFDYLKLFDRNKSA